MRARGLREEIHPSWIFSEGSGLHLVCSLHNGRSPPKGVPGCGEVRRIGFTKTGIYKRECLTVLAIKFLVTPLVVLSAAVLLGVGFATDLPVLSVAKILAAMPVAFMATKPPTLYSFEFYKVNSCWLVSTAGLPGFQPVLSVLIPFTL